MDRTTAIVVGLCVALLVLWYAHFGRMTPPVPPPSEPVEVVPDPDPQPEPAPVPLEPVAAAAADPGRAFPRPESRPPAELITIRDNDTVALKLDGEKGGIVRAVLQEYTQYSDPGEGRGELVELGNWRFPLASLVTAAEVRQRRLLTRQGAAMVLESILESGVTVVEEWRFPAGNDYLLDYTVQLRNENQNPVEITGLMVTAGGLDPDGAGNGGPWMQRMGMMQLGIDFLPTGAGHPRRFDPGDIGKLTAAGKVELAMTPTDWLAIHNKYFFFFVRPLETPAAGVMLAYQERTQDPAGETGLESEWVYGGLTLPDLRLPAGGEQRWHFHVYAGPKEYYRIRELGPGLTSILGMDCFFFGRARWMGVLSTFILRALLGLRELGLSFGLAIVAVTVIIKILFLPLTHKSAVAMRRMQKLQPLVKEIREKHKNEPQVMNQKTMALYREHKANPLGGCLPMLCQIPVFLALFNTLRSAIELRQSSFLWVVDLSQPDTLAFMPFGLPIRPLALLMGGSMMLQQKMTPTTADPAQSRMMMYMSLFFIFLFYSMPAGLTLYWTINQLLTIGQHALLRKMEERGGEETAPAAESRPRRGG